MQKWSKKKDALRIALGNPPELREARVTRGIHDKSLQPTKSDTLFTCNSLS